MTISEFVKLRLLDTKSQANIDLREAPDSAAGEAVRRNARLTLAWADAALRIVAWCSERDRIYVGGLGDDPTDPSKYVDGGLTHSTDSPVLRVLAAVYSDHPDYREEWEL